MCTNERTTSILYYAASLPEDYRKTVRQTLGEYLEELTDPPSREVLESLMGNAQEISSEAKTKLHKLNEMLRAEHERYASKGHLRVRRSQAGA